MLVIVSGLPGTGKSTLADGIGIARRAPVLSVDPIESAILRAGIARSFQTGLAAYLVAEACADAFLRTGQDVVIDAVSGVEPARDMWRALAARHETPLRVIVTTLPEVETAHRLAARDRHLERGEPTAEERSARADEWTDWPEPHLVVDSSVAAEGSLSRVLEWLSS